MKASTLGWIFIVIGVVIAALDAAAYKESGGYWFAAAFILIGYFFIWRDTHKESR